MNFGKKNCCGNCLQDVLDREGKANAPAAKADFAIEVRCATAEPSATTKLFRNGNNNSKGDRLFQVDLAREWVRP